MLTDKQKGKDTDVGKKIKNLDELERFEVVAAMFPDKLNDDENDIGDEEDIIIDEFNITPEKFDYLVAKLTFLAPVMQSPLTGERHHSLGHIEITEQGQSITALVKRKFE